jgi:hypothetical protein
MGYVPTTPMARCPTNIDAICAATILFCAWLNHVDSRVTNTLDTLVEENGRQYLRHHLLDFGAILGSSSTRPKSPRTGGEYLFAWGPTIKEIATLGLWVPPWAFAQFADDPAVGRFEAEVFDPDLDRFAVHNGELVFEDLAKKDGMGETGPLKIIWSRFDNDFEQQTPMRGEQSFSTPKEALQSPVTAYYAAQMSRDDDTRRSVTVYIRSGQQRAEVVGLDRLW